MFDVLQIASSLGVGAFLAIVIAMLSFRYIRDTTAKLRDDRRYMEDRLSSLLEQDQRSREANTKVLSELVTLIQRLNGKLKS